MTNLEKNEFILMRGILYMLPKFNVVVQGLNTFRKFQNEER